MNTRRVIAIVAFFAGAVSLPLAVSAQAPEPPPEPPAVAPDPAPGGEIVHSWALAPAGSNDPSQPSDRSALSYTADPGAVIDDAVTLYNLGNVDLEFEVYATDAINNDDGTISVLSSAEQPTDVGSWVVVQAPDVVPVSAGNQVTIPIRLVIPADARPGDHIGALLAANQTSTGSEGGTVALDRRTGTNLLVRVNGPITAELAITELEADYDASMNPLGGSVNVSYRIENRGDIRASGTSNVTVGGPFGLGEKSLPPFEFNSLLPGQDIVVTAQVDDVPATGIVTTKVEIVPDTSGDDVALQPVSRSTTSFAPPIALLLLSLAGLFGVLAMRGIKRHRENDLDESQPPMAEREPQLT